MDIAKKEITGFSFTASDKTYDGKTDAEVTGITLTGVLDADKNDVALTGSAAFENADAAAGKTVTYTAAGLTGSKADNYVLGTGAQTAQTTATISPMPISFTVGTTTFAYDENPKPVTVTAVDANGALFTHFEVLYDGKTEAPTDADEYDLSVQLTNDVTAGNYDITGFPADAKLTITAVSQDQLTIVGLPGSVEYGDTFTLQVLGGTGDGAITWTSDNEDVTVTNDNGGSTTDTIGAAVGDTVTIKATKAADGNHEAKETSVVFIPVAKNVQFTLSGTTTTYNGSAQGVTVNTPGVSVVTFTVSYNGNTDVPPNAGTYIVAVTGTGNYAGSTYGLLTINKATLSDLTVSLDGWTYDGGNDTHTPSVAGDTKSLTPVYSYSTLDGQQPVNAGTYTVYATFSGDNYETLRVQSTFTIAKAKLTAKADDATRTYGQANPAFTITYSGFVNNEDESVLWQEPMATCSAIPTSPAGDYDIVLTGGQEEN